MIAPSENVAEMIRKLAFERFRKSLDQSLEKRKAKGLLQAAEKIRD
jgi:hypothetical protein